MTHVFVVQILSSHLRGNVDYLWLNVYPIIEPSYSDRYMCQSGCAVTFGIGLAPDTN